MLIGSMVDMDVNNYIFARLLLALLNAYFKLQLL